MKSQKVDLSPIESEAQRKVNGPLIISHLNRDGMETLPMLVQPKVGPEDAKTGGNTWRWRGKNKMPYKI